MDRREGQPAARGHTAWKRCSQDEKSGSLASVRTFVRPSVGYFCGGWCVAVGAVVVGCLCTVLIVSQALL